MTGTKSTSTRILIVEDDGVIVLHLKNILTRLGYDVVGLSATGRKALRMVKEMSPDLALMDIKLTGKMTGIEAVAQIQAGYDIPVVYSTAYPDKVLWEEAKVTEPFGYLIKPFQGRELRATIEMALYRHKVERKLKESEEKHRTLFETMVQGVVYQDASGKIISANPAAERILGLTLDQMQGRTSVDPRWKAIHEDGSDFPGETHPAMVSLKTGGPVRDVVMGVFHPDEGKHRWININAVPQFKPGENAPYQVYTTFSDITERKRSEEALRKSEHSLANAQRVSKVGHYEWNLKTNTIIWSDEMYRIFGVDKATYTPTVENFAALIHPDDLHVLSPENAERLISTKNHELGYRIIDQTTRETKHIHLWGETIFNADGVPIHILGIFQDITERKQAEDALRESEERLRGFIDASIETITLFDAGLNYIMINEAGLNMFPPGTRAEDVLGKHLLKVLPGIEATGRYEQYLKVIRTGEPFTAERVVPDPILGDIYWSEIK